MSRPSFQVGREKKRDEPGTRMLYQKKLGEYSAPKTTNDAITRVVPSFLCFLPVLLSCTWRLKILALSRSPRTWNYVVEFQGRIRKKTWGVSHKEKEMVGLVPGALAA